MLLPREGFTADFVGRIVRSSLLNPIISVPLALSIHWGSSNDPTPSGWRPVLEQAQVFTYFVATCGALLHATEFLNKQYHNNWTSSSHWDWRNEIVVITGGSSGIGASLAQQLHARNPHTKIVIIDYIPLTWSPPNGSQVHYYQCDLSQASGIEMVCEKIRREVGHPTVLVNNAGICRGFTVCEGSYTDVEVTIKTNLIAPFLLVKEFLPIMARSNHGHIINISSMSAFLPPSKVADYAATKTGLIALHEALQLELKYAHNAPRVRLSLAMLSFIRTPLFKGETKQSAFWFPVLDVNTVSESLAEILYSGYGKTIYLPGIMRYVAMLKGGPEWIWRAAREGTNKLAVDFKGRQEVSAKTGGML